MGQLILWELFSFKTIVITVNKIITLSNICDIVHTLKPLGTWIIVSVIKYLYMKSINIKTNYKNIFKDKDIFRLKRIPLSDNFSVYPPFLFLNENYYMLFLDNYYYNYHRTTITAFVSTVTFLQRAIQMHHFSVHSIKSSCYSDITKASLWYA